MSEEIFKNQHKGKIRCDLLRLNVLFPTCIYWL